MKGWFAARRFWVLGVACCIVLVATLWAGRVPFRFPSATTGTMLAVPLALTVSALPALVWIGLRDAGRFELEKVAVRGFQIASLDALSVWALTAVLGEAEVLWGDTAAGRDLLWFMGLGILSGQLAGWRYAYWVPVAQLVLGMLLGFEPHARHPAIWAFPLDSRPGEGTFAVVVVMVLSICMGLVRSIPSARWRSIRVGDPRPMIGRDRRNSTEIRALAGHASPHHQSH